MYKRIRNLAVLLFLPILLLNLNCAPVSSSQEGGGSKAAPDFTLSDLEGNQVTLSQFMGKKHVLLVFGATWCPYCIDEIPELKEIYERYKDREVKLLYIDIQESARKVGSMVKNHSIPYTVLLDTDGSVAGAYGVRGIPHQVIVDKETEIYYQGPRPSGGLMSLLHKLTENNKSERR